MKATILLILMGLLTSCSTFFYYPDSKTYFTPEQFVKSYQSFDIKTEDGITIKAKLLKTKNKVPKGTIIQFHGNAQNMSSHMASLVWLTELGYDLFIFDYRGYGNSEGSPDPEGLNFDAQAALKKAKECQIERKAKKFIVYGQSLGGAVLMRALEDYGTEGIDHLILESTFMSYRNIAIKKMKSGAITYLFFPLAYLIVNNSYSASSVPEIPLLVIHGKKDPVVEFEFGEEIFNKGKEPKELWQIPEEQHINAYFVEQGKYRGKLINYLK